VQWRPLYNTDQGPLERRTRSPHVVDLPDLVMWFANDGGLDPYQSYPAWKLPLADARLFACPPRGRKVFTSSA